MLQKSAQKGEDSRSLITSSPERSPWSTTVDAHAGSWPAAASLASCSPANVVLTVLKLSEDGDNLILRGYETAGLETESEIRLGLAGTQCTATWSPHEIKTLRWRQGDPAPVEVNMLKETAPLPPPVVFTGGIEGEASTNL